MAETSEKLHLLSETDILMRFRESLVVLLPILKELDCVENDSSFYDPFDRLAESLWSELVVESLRWKYGLASTPILPRYGFAGLTPGPDGYIRVKSGDRDLQLIGFLGNRAFGEAPFNAVAGAGPAGERELLALSSQVEFHWQRGPSEA